MQTLQSEVELDSCSVWNVLTTVTLGSGRVFPDDNPLLFE